MKIAIAGTRGIPNNYGGFEQCAEIISVMFKEMGHDVTVYNSHFHPFRESNFKGVNVVHIYNPENKIGTAGNFVYDYLSMRHAVKSGHDILLVLGYTTASIFYPIMNFKKTILITNMDGLEWKRDKWNNVVKKLAYWFEKLGARYSKYMVSDNEEIRSYLKNTYGRDSAYIAYGCEKFTNPDPGILKKYNVTPNMYSLVIARMEAENNIAMILEGFSKSNDEGRLIIIGNVVTSYGKKLHEHYKNNNKINFLGGIYEPVHLNNLRYYSRFYFHGHSVGGTNPSLLEAMACGCMIFAHGNKFNRSVLGDEAVYFSDAAGLTKQLDNSSFLLNQKPSLVRKNYLKVEQKYSWKNIASSYEAYFREVCLI